MTANKKAIVAGGGLVGALWAIFMAKRGYDVEVFEQRSDMRIAGYSGGRSINLAMSERGWKAVRKAGIEDKIRKVAIPMYGRMIHSLSGELTFQPYGETGQAIYSVSRGGLNLELLRIADRFENVKFHFDHKCRGVDLDNNIAAFEHIPTGDRIQMQAPLIFGTDGAFSAVRNSMLKRPRFNYSQSFLDYGYKELTIPATDDGRHAMPNLNALHIWPRHNFMLIALPNADGSFTCTLFLPFEGGEDAFDHLNTDDEVMRFFERNFPDAIPLMPTLLEDFHHNPTSALVTVRCTPWEVAGRTLLLGDAAHAIVPFFGQGMNAGFEDCTILDEMADHYGEDWGRILPEFSSSRAADANAIADLALNNFVEMRDLVADPDFLLRKQITAHLHEKYPDQFIPMYTMVSFSHVPYSRALAEGKAQDVLFDRILAIDDIADSWEDNPSVDAIFHAWRKEFPN
ncbi:MAG: FAD-dependent monooxygenase [Saprospiraceae bacterium]|nr:FAD-dependent monooxygenase [Saprospiraceae bacterium]